MERPDIGLLGSEKMKIFSFSSVWTRQASEGRDLKDLQAGGAGA